MKNIIYHTVGTLPESNRKIVRTRGKIESPNTYMNVNLIV